MTVEDGPRTQRRTITYRARVRSVDEIDDELTDRIGGAYVRAG